MRKVILVALVVILAIICILIVGVGIKIGPFKIYNYSEIEKSNSERKVLLSELKEKNGGEFNSLQKQLIGATQKYKEKKAEYDSLIESGELTTESNIYNSSLYDLDYLLTVVGNYATQNSVTLQFDVFKSASTSVSTEYIICDLNFTVTGGYIPITNYIYNIEDDDTLNFEINDFVLEKGGEDLQATFTVKNVPINSKTLSSIPTNSTSNMKINN